MVSEGQEVHVLGTEFNVSAYPDDPDTKTTLVEGIVRLATTTGQQPPLKITPGQQSILQKGVLQIQTVDVQDYIGWKNGVIILNQADLPTVVRQIERWYDVEFDWDGLPLGTKLNGVLHCKANLSAILKVLSLNTGKTFQIEGRRIMVN